MRKRVTLEDHMREELQWSRIGGPVQLKRFMGDLHAALALLQVTLQQWDKASPPSDNGHAEIAKNILPQLSALREQILTHMPEGRKY